MCSKIFGEIVSLLLSIIGILAPNEVIRLLNGVFTGFRRSQATIDEITTFVFDQTLYLAHNWILHNHIRRKNKLVVAGRCLGTMYTAHMAVNSGQCHIYIPNRHTKHVVWDNLNAAPPLHIYLYTFGYHNTVCVVHMTRGATDNTYHPLTTHSLFVVIRRDWASLIFPNRLWALCVCAVSYLPTRKIV